jgi:lipopolysaccharide transport protein LptA
MPQGSPPSRRVKQDGDPRKEPIHIKSDGQASYAKNGGLIHITQNVVISQSDLRFQADEAKVWVKEGDAEENIEKVECVGNVKVSKYSEDPAEKVTARGQKALFYNDQRKVVLQGDARLWRGGHLIKGAQITYNLDDGMITVDRAEGVVQPEEKKKGPKAVAKPAARGKEARP